MAETVKLHNKGVIRFDSLDGAKFFLRAFHLEREVQQALKMLRTKAPKAHDRISCPIVAEYKVDETLTFVFAFVLTCDPLGVIGGGGMVYYASPDNMEEALKFRDQLADDIFEAIDTAKPTHFFRMTDSGKEEGRVLD